MKNIICLDIETTGLNAELGDEVVQLSIIDGDGATLFNEYIKPETMTSWEAAEAIHHISPSDVADKKPLSFFKDEIERIINHDDVEVGYNLIGFDIPFLKQVGINIKDDLEISDVMLDFAEIYGEKKENGEYKWQKLTKCAEYYGYEFNAHDSLEDVKATLHCYNKIHEWRQDVTIQMEKEARLSKVINEEFNEYIEQERKRSPIEIINNAHEIAIKQELHYIIENCIEDWGVEESIVDGLLKMQHPLDACYQRWLKEDVSLIEDLSYIIEREAVSLNKAFDVEIERNQEEELEM